MGHKVKAGCYKKIFVYVMEEQIMIKGIYCEHLSTIWDFHHYYVYQEDDEFLVFENELFPKYRYFWPIKTWWTHS